VITVVDPAPENVARAPEDAVVCNVTAIPDTGFPAESITVATNGLANTIFTVALCPPPLVAVIDGLFGDWHPV
jgi:hypothetical protein